MGEDVVAVLPEPVKLGEIRARHEKLVADMLAFSIRVLYQPDGQQAHADRAALLSVLTATRRALENVLATGLNGGNNVRLAFLAATQDALDAETLAQAERSEEAVNEARAALALATDAP